MERGSEREWVWSWRRILTTSRGAMTKLFRDIGLGWVWGGGYRKGGGGGEEHTERLHRLWRRRR